MSSPNSKDARTPAAVALGCAGMALTDAERAFFREADPFGLILFARNVGAPDALSRLIRDFREIVGRPDAPVFIDQEGGRVARLRPPHWPALPAQGRIGALAEAGDMGRARQAAILLGHAIAASVAPVGFDVACAPDADVRAPDANQAVIGDRAYSGDPDIVGELAAATEQALRAAGIATTPKHAPGHGRARVDSHHDLPRVETGLADLRADLRAFAGLTMAPFWMTAHIVYETIDPALPATCSRACLDWLRAESGYRGLILSDDLAMNALDGVIPGGVEGRAAAAREAGCDLLLYCPGDLEGGAAAVAGAGRADAQLLEGWRRWTDTRPAPPVADPFQLAAELWAMIDPVEASPVA